MMTNEFLGWIPAALIGIAVLAALVWRVRRAFRIMREDAKGEPDRTE